MKREMDCFRARRLGCGLVCAGFAALPIGALVRWMGFGDPGVLGVLCCGWLLCLCLCGNHVLVNGCVCPNCGAPLQRPFRMMSPIPHSCPNCGERLEKTCRF